MYMNSYISQKCCLEEEPNHLFSLLLYLSFCLSIHSFAHSAAHLSLRFYSSTFRKNLLHVPLRAFELETDSILLDLLSQGQLIAGPFV